MQIDFTEGRLALKLDPSGGLLRTFVELNNRVLSAFNDSERKTIGVHTCPGGDRDSTHSADVDYTRLLPDLFQMKVGRFYIQLASEVDRKCVLKSIAGLLKPGQMVFVGVTDPIDPKIESPEVFRDRVMEAAECIPLESLGTTDDCGFSPFADDRSTSRETAFAKIRAKVEGTAMAEKKLGRRRCPAKVNSCVHTVAVRERLCGAPLLQTGEDACPHVVRGGPAIRMSPQKSRQI